MSARQSSGGEAADREFDLFVASASPGLLRAAYLLSGDRSDAEDLLQGALLSVFRRWDAISGSPKGYAFTVLVNLSRDHRRWRRRQPAAQAAEAHGVASDRDPIERLLDRSEIVQAARSLPSVQQTVLACRYLLDLSVSETAATLDLPEGTVKSYTARALGRMRDLLSDSNSAVEVGSAD